MTEVNESLDVVAPPGYTIGEIEIPGGPFPTLLFDGIESNLLNGARSCPICGAHPADPFNEACSCLRRESYHVQPEGPFQGSDSDSVDGTPATESPQREPIAARLFGRHARIAHGAFSGFLYLTLCIAYTSMTTFIGWSAMTAERNESSACVFEMFSAATVGNIILVVMSLYVWTIARLLVKESQRLQDHGIDPFGRKAPRWWEGPQSETLLPALPQRVQCHDWAQYAARPVYLALVFLLSSLYGPALGLSLPYGGRKAPEGMPTTTDALAWGAFGTAFTFALLVMVAIMVMALNVFKQKIRYRV